MSEGVKSCEQCGEWILFCYPCRLHCPDPLWDEVIKRMTPTLCPECEAKQKVLEEEEAMK